jgi:hypothetical protein
VVHDPDSGETIETHLDFEPFIDRKGPQAFGSVNSYMRRYMLVSLFLVATTDDDAEAATVREPAAPKAAKKPPAKKEKALTADEVIAEIQKINTQSALEVWKGARATAINKHIFGDGRTKVREAYEARLAELLEEEVSCQDETT